MTRPRERRIRNDLAAYVRRRLAEKEWSQEKLAKEMGDKNKSRVARLVAGEKAEGQALTLPLIVDLAKGLGEPPLQLLAALLAPPDQVEALHQEAEEQFAQELRKVYQQHTTQLLTAVQSEHAEAIFTQVGRLARYLAGRC